MTTSPAAALAAFKDAITEIAVTLSDRDATLTTDQAIYAATTYIVGNMRAERPDLLRLVYAGLAAA